MADSSKLLFFCLAVLLFESVFLAYFVLGKYGETATGIPLPSELQYSSTQDFTNNSIDLETLNVASAGIVFTNGLDGWVYTNSIGRVLVLPLAYTIGDPIYLLVNNIQKDSTGIITNTYIINNSVKNDYIIVLRYTGGSDQNEIRITSDGFHIPSFIPFTQILSGTDIYFYPYANANKVSSVTITTKYDDNKNTVDFYFNGQKIFTANNLNVDSPIVIPLLDVANNGRFYGGFASRTSGMTLVSFTTNNIIKSTSSTGVLNAITDFIAIMAQVIIWSVDEKYLPSTLVLLMVKPFELGVLIAVLWK